MGQITNFSAGLVAGTDAPFAIAPGSDGNLWFTGVPSAVGRITPTGTITKFTVGLNPDSIPAEITPGPDGNLWFTDLGTTRAIGRIDPFTQTITNFTAGLNAGSAPQAITAGPDGNLWFTDNGTTDAIGRITPTGTITEFSTALNTTPVGIAPGPDGNLWFTDQGAAQSIGRITPSGMIAEFNTGLGAGSTPDGITPGPDGNLWFTDRGSPDAIGRIDPVTQTITKFSVGLNPGTIPRRITPGADGNLWFSDGGTTSAIGRITTTGAITNFTAGLNAGSILSGIAPGPDGNLWFADRGTTDAIGRLGVAAPAPSLVPPGVLGSAEQGTQQRCGGDRWANWAGEQPAPNSPASLAPGVQWLRDGAPLPGETAQAYTPAAADVGHALSCTVAVTYPLLNVTASATSDAVTVIAQGAGPAGPQGASGPQGPAGPPGRDATVTCKPKGKKVKCAVAFASASGVRHARLSRDGVTYAEGKPAAAGGGKLMLRFRTSRRPQPGRYTLTVVQRLDGQKVITRSAVRVG